MKHWLASASFFTSASFLTAFLIFNCTFEWTLQLTCLVLVSNTFDKFKFC